MQVTHLAQAFCQRFSITPQTADSIGFQTDSSGEEEERHHTAVQQLPPHQDQQTCCATVNGRRIWLFSSSERSARKEHSASFNALQSASTSKESLEQGSIPKAFLWSMMTIAVTSTACSSPITTLWSTTCELQFVSTEVASRIFLSPH